MNYNTQLTYCEEDLHFQFVFLCCRNSFVVPRQLNSATETKRAIFLGTCLDTIHVLMSNFLFLQLAQRHPLFTFLQHPRGVVLSISCLPRIQVAIEAP